MKSMIQRVVAWVADFVQERDLSSSCTRLCAILCCVTGCCCAGGTLWFAFTNPGQPATVAALVGLSTALIGGGCVAIVNRTRIDPAVPAA